MNGYEFILGGSIVIAVDNMFNNWCNRKGKP